MLSENCQSTVIRLRLVQMVNTAINLIYTATVVIPVCTVI
nr:MAG TPA: hypothetical protein [Caudoviricetes sp.]